MAGKSVLLDVAPAREAAGLLAVSADLKLVIDCCDLLLGFPRDETGAVIGQLEAQGTVLVEALWTTAIIAYARCFIEGKRLRLSDAQLHERPDLKATHQNTLAVRHRQIAHSVNELEISAAAVLLSGDPEPEHVDGSTMIYARMVAPPVAAVSGVRDCAQYLQEVVTAGRQEALRNLTTEAQQRTADELAALPSAELRSGKYEESARARAGEAYGRWTPVKDQEGP